ncbi:MAG: Holliday junction branch migration protein RuvA [Oscillatoria princeps RMCB-10]|jgi:Holliday junction DNA helicase RuvA|nr:Holliday junction branch migration protein RuvA [Oscillatoria princeps RMCB-10]
MISYLKGTVAGIHRGTGNRVTLILEVNQIGCELQIPPRMEPSLPAGASVQVFTHLQVREEQPVLYGFASAAERDLFRQLVSVSGVGAQLAISLLDTLGLQDLVGAIVTGNTRMLAKTRGVGSKTAERIALELKSKLAQWRSEIGDLALLSTGSSPALCEDVEITLLALGYTSSEVMQALRALNSDPSLSNNPDAEQWIRAAITWLSRR